MSELTKEQIIENFLSRIKRYVEFWNAQEFSTTKEMLEGLAHSILVIIDGESTFPQCKLIPSPYKDDKEYSILHKVDYYPENIDISGELHNSWNQLTKKVGNYIEVFNPEENRGWKETTLKTIPKQLKAIDEDETYKYYWHSKLMYRVKQYEK